MTFWCEITPIVTPCWYHTCLIKWPNPAKLKRFNSLEETLCISKQKDMSNLPIWFQMGTLNSSVIENNFLKKKWELFPSLSLQQVTPRTPLRQIPTMTPSSSSYKPFLVQSDFDLRSCPLNQRSASPYTLSPTTQHAPLTQMTNKPPFPPSASVYQSLCPGI